MESEIPKIASFLNISKDDLMKNLQEIEIFHTKLFKFDTTKKPFGPCVHLKDNKCAIHDVKPLHCKLCNCKNGEDAHTWFLVNYCLNIHDPESIRQYNSYIETDGKVLKGAELDILFKDKKKLKKILDYDIIK